LSRLIPCSDPRDPPEDRPPFSFRPQDKAMRLFASGSRPDQPCVLGMARAFGQRGLDRRWRTGGHCCDSLWGRCFPLYKRLRLRSTPDFPGVSPIAL